jgi:ribosome-associated heat shock protein Hsp15
MSENRVAAKLVDIYRRNDTPASVSAFRITKIIKRTLSKKMVPEDPRKKDRRDIDEFGNEIIVNEED